MDMLLVLDVDGTLVDSRHLADLWHEDPRAWESVIAAGRLAPIPDAIEALAALPPVALALVTSRPEALREATVAWLAQHHPRLAGAPLQMRQPDDDRPGWQVKGQHIRAMRGPRRVLLVDDDYDAGQAVAKGDLFLHVAAPQRWCRLAGLLAAR